MTKPVIVTRANKGAPLTRTELDNNFNNLDNATISVAGDSGSISNNLNSTFNINGGNGIGTAVQSGNLVVNLNGVYGGDSTSSTTVGNNTAVLLASVATSGSYNDLTDKPSSGALKVACYEKNNPESFSSNGNYNIDYFSGPAAYKSDPYNLITPNVDGVTGRFQINSAGTYLIQTLGTVLGQTNNNFFGFYDVTSGSMIEQIYTEYFNFTNTQDNRQNYILPTLAKIVTIASTNKYELYTDGRNSDMGSFKGTAVFMITKLA